MDRNSPRWEIIRFHILLGHHTIHRTKDRKGSSHFHRILRVPRVINKISSVSYSSRIYGKIQ